jgi:RNA polymerase sigma factor (sigma-70 family)
MAQSPLRKLLGHIHRTVGPHGSAPPADAELLDRFLADRDDAAFAALVLRHGNLVLAACRRVLVNRADVDDAFQATFLVLLRKASSIRQHQSVGGWLYRVARRAALHVRADVERHRPVEPGLIPESAAPTDADPSWREVCALLHAELDRLPVKFRLPLMLCYLDGKTRDEAARQLGWSVGAVKGNLERGRMRLREQLARRGVTLSAALLATLAAPRGLAIPTALVNSTLHTALNTPAALAGGSRAALVAHGVLQSMRTTHRLVVALSLLLIGAAGTGAGLWTRHVLAGKPTDPIPAAAQAPTRTAAEETMTVSGQVLNPDGQPVAGAKLYTLRLPPGKAPSDDNIETVVRGSSGPDGRFRFDAPKGELGTAADGSPLPILAAADGYGVNWSGAPKPGEELILKLVKDQPITGRVLDGEGQPVANAAIRVLNLVTGPDDRLDDFLAGWKTDWQDSWSRGLKQTIPPSPVVRVTPTDRDGRFQITGAGAERVLIVVVKAPTIAQSMFYVVARSGFDPKPYNDAADDLGRRRMRLPGHTPQLFGPTFTFVAAPGKTLEGIVREANGKPLIGVRVGAIVGSNNSVFATTDAQGKFTLTGLPKQPNYILHVGPRAQDAFVDRSVNVPDTEGLQPVKAEIELMRGVVVSGRVIDRQTGKGVLSGVRFVPLPQNTFFGKPGYDSYRQDHTMRGTDQDGRFRLVVIPGPGVLMVQAHSGESHDGQYLNPYQLATFDEEGRKHVEVMEDGVGGYFAAAGNALEPLGNENAIKYIDLAENTAAVSHDLYLHRGKTATVILQDQDGQPLTEGIVSGMAAKWPITFTLKKAECTVYALDPQKPRTLVFYHPVRKLGGSLSVRGDEPGPLTAKLLPTGTVIGRILDADGQPIAGADVGVSYQTNAGSELERFLRPQREPIRTDKDGRFRLDGVVPEVKFSLSLRQGPTFLVGKPRIGVKNVQTGQTLDLGDRRTEPQGP